MLEEGAGDRKNLFHFPGSTRVTQKKNTQDSPTPKKNLGGGFSDYQTVTKRDYRNFGDHGRTSLGSS